MTHEMTRKPPSICLNPNDPAFVEKARVYLFDLYRFKRNKRLAPLPPPEGAVATPERRFVINVSKLPRDYLTCRQLDGLCDVYNKNDHFIDTLMEGDVDSTEEATRRLFYWAIAEAVNHFILSTMAFLALDQCVSPGNPCRDASFMIGWGEGAMWRRYETLTRDWPALAAACRAACPSVWQDAEIQEGLAVLRETGQLFFVTIGMIFPVRSIAKCQNAFIGMMDDVGTFGFAASVDNYIHRRKIMQRDIKEWRRHGGTVSEETVARALQAQAEAIQAQTAAIQAQTAAIEANTAATQTNTKAVANMDRRQQTFLGKLSTVLSGFINLLKSSRTPPTREQAQTALAPPNRYACLEGIVEPHRSQVKAVIDYTLDHPVLFKKKHVGDFTLDTAVKAVWAKNAETWAKIPGTFTTERDLHAACYHWRGKPNDPFNYLV